VNQLIETVKKNGKIKTFGYSMMPILQDGDVVSIQKVSLESLRINDIICFRQKNRLVTHRVVYKTKSYVITKGDNNPVSDGKILKNKILGKISAIERKEQKFDIDDLYLFQSSIYFEEIKRVVGMFKKAGIDQVILKGLPLHLFLEKKHQRRIYADCDILVAKKDCFRARNLLKNEGYQKVDFPLSSKHKKLKDKDVEESFVKKISGYTVVFDIHYEAAFMMTQLGKLEYLYPQKLLEDFTKSLLNNKRIVEIGDGKFPLLSLEEQIVYLFLHLFHHNFRGGYRYDILVKILGMPFDKNKLIHIITEYKLTNFVYPGLMLLNEYYPDEKYQKLFGLLTVSKQVRKYVSKKVLPIRIFDGEERIGAGTKRFLLIFNLSPRPILIRYLTILNKQVLYSIYWVLVNKTRLIILQKFPFLRPLLQRRAAEFKR